ncbi:dephospho-CoA kinase [Methylomarinovum caldicuralii]|uniref:Dephospho-CoA kinase n=1 Tax=Methylomarinovum caldicuralii TaxID=438856 RepID=A0AAU9C2N9_9GAMM|nr:dephospho-CoA kinase [Methylomarinovum caldicuralii]BCX82667.1 dephospho-CoA kinase [Methylomarinovum caldicuralii]
MLKIVLTGGIGSGKSTVARLFQRHGVPVIDTDEIARDLVRPGRPALGALVDAFGPRILTADGRLDRARLRELVFSDPAAKARLEAILHPRIFSELERRLQALKAPYVVIAIPLLVETGARGRVDRVLVVDCPEALQIERVRHRDGWDEALIRRILASQAGRLERLAVADDVIVNDRDLAHLARQVAELHRLYLRLSAERDDP